MIARTAIGAAFFALAACSPTTDAPETAAPAPAEGPVAVFPDSTAEITAADIGARVAELADDKYEGRGPGTVAGEAAAQWIADEMARIGLQPGNNGSWFQTVEMVGQTVDPGSSSMTITANGEEIPLALGTEAVYVTLHQDKETVSIADSELVFVGYGVNAPEAGWNDYEGVDVTGKTVVMFVNDPGFITDDDSLFGGRAMTYYGRWTYKYEEASRQGAAAAILIHESEPASYGWEVVQNSWTGEQANLVLADAGASRTLVDGWVQLDIATDLFNRAGLDINEQRAAANQRGFTAVPMTGLTASATINQKVEFRDSRNVIGTLPGAERPDEHVLFTAHWDHLGVNRDIRDNVDKIFNGAVDNATGVAIILDIAEKMAADPQPERSVTFLAVTLEESGLLGSAYYADNPIIPLNKTVGGLNIDAVLPTGESRDAVVVGYGASEMEDLLKEVMDEQGRTIVPDPEPQAGYFYRSDHVSLAKKGVPMLYADGGVDLVEGGVAAGTAAGEAYRIRNYHAVTDEYSPDWELGSLVQVGVTDYELAKRLANSDQWPAWYEGNEFKAIRDASLAGE